MRVRDVISNAQVQINPTKAYTNEHNINEWPDISKSHIHNTCLSEIWHLHFISVYMTIIRKKTSKGLVQEIFSAI